MLSTYYRIPNQPKPVLLKWKELQKRSARPPRVVSQLENLERAEKHWERLRKANSGKRFPEREKFAESRRRKAEEQKKRIKQTLKQYWQTPFLSLPVEE
jgi:5'-deoxynucleotidase YfbR-like HD superfamily hydrolase